MHPLQKAGAYAAFFQALTYIVGFVVMAIWLNPGDAQGWSPAQKLAFVLERKALFQAWELMIYVAFGLALVVLTVALHDRLKEQAPVLMQIASPFGLIWAGLVIASGMVASVGLETVAALYSRNIAEATSNWQLISVIQDGLGGGVEIVGGCWVLLVGAAAIRSQLMPIAWGYLSVFVGICGVLTVVPPLKELASVFGISQIFWFSWVGMLLLRRIGS